MERDRSYEQRVPSLDGWQHAHNAMVRAVAREGAKVLSDPRRLASLLDDELAGLPRERVLLVRAAEAEVPAIIDGMVSRSGTDRAVELAAATVLALHGRDPDGCLWVAAEMARVIGYRPADHLTIAEWVGQPGGYGEFAPRPGPAAATSTARSEPEPDHLPDLADVSTSGGETLAPPPRDIEYQPRFKPRRRSHRLPRPGAYVGVLASLVLIYFALAGIFLLPPYGKQNANPPPETASNGALANQRALLSHVPAAIRPHCQPSAGIANPEIVASVTCAVSSSSGDTIGVIYDLFGNSGAAEGAFSTDVTPGAEGWGPIAALGATQSCDPSVDAAFSGTGTYQRAASPNGAVTTSDSGQIACWVSSAQEPTIDWTSTTRTIDGNAVIMKPSAPAPPTQADEAALFAFWKVQAGPQ